MVKIVIPVSDEEGELLSAHFGRAPYFAWFEIKNGEVVDKGVVPNDSEHFGGTGRPPQRILRLDPDVVVSMGMGMRAISMFQGARVAVLKAKTERSEENLALFLKGELAELTEGCLHARRH